MAPIAWYAAAKFLRQVINDSRSAKYCVSGKSKFTLVYALNIGLPCASLLSYDRLRRIMMELNGRDPRNDALKTLASLS